MCLPTSPTDTNEEYCIIEQYNTLEKIFYWILSIIGLIYGYITLIPYFLRYRSFKNIHLNDVLSVCVDDQGKHEKTYRNVKSVDNLSVGFPGAQILGDVIKNAAALYGDRKFFGNRKVLEKKPYKDETTGRIFKKYSLGEYEWKSFEEVATLVEHFKNGLLQIDNIWENKNDQALKMVIFAKISEEWVVSELGIFATGSVLVTVFSNMDDASIVYALNQTEPTVLIVDKNSLKRLNQLIDNFKWIKNVIVIGRNIDKSKIPLTKNTAINIWTYDEIIELGSINNSNVVSIDQPAPDDLAIIMYTSGSSGRPKGVCLSHLNVLTPLGCLPRKELMRYLDTAPFYLPCAHILGFECVILSMLFGFKIGHCRTLTLFDGSPGVMEGTKGDFTELKPTGSFIVPLIVDRLVKTVISKIKSQPRFLQFLFDFALQYKIYFLRLGHIKAPIIDRNAIGGRLKLVYSAGGPISKETSLMFSALFNVNLKQIYGTTESSGGGTFSDFHGPYSLDCGAPFPCCEIKLIPWQEGNYHPDDIPNPRGEICLYGAQNALSYYKLDEETNRKFVIDEKTDKIWFHTGDIGEYLPNGNFKIIDRKDNIIKLTNGEFISLASVENCVCNSDFVEVCCCLPSSSYDSLVAIIVPKRLKIMELLGSQQNLQHIDDLDPYINDPDIQKIITDDVKSKLSYL